MLREENLIVSRQGSGVYVRERTAKPVGLRPHVEAAFGVGDVRIDFAGFTAETLHNAIQEPLDEIRAGRLTPRAVTIRLLLVDTTVGLAIPARVDGGDSAGVRERMAHTIDRYAGGIAESVRELAALGLIEHGRVDLRVQPSSSAVKVYLLNGSEIFYGFYPVLQHTVVLDGKDVSINDPMGKDTLLFHQATNGDPDSLGGQQIAEATRWFDSVWSTIARPYPL